MQIWEHIQTNMGYFSPNGYWNMTTLQVLELAGDNLSMFFNSETAKIDTFPGAIFVGLSMAMGVPQNRWFIMDYPTKMDDLKVPPFQETSKWKTINGTQMNITIKSFLLLDNQRLTMETCGNIEPIGNCGKKYQTFIRKYVWWVRF